MVLSWRYAFRLEALRLKERAQPTAIAAGRLLVSRDDVVNQAAAVSAAALALLHAVVSIEGQRREQIFDDPALAGENLGLHGHAGQQRRGTAVDVE